jgi:tritrans,polycis-undecaprenyl-diphosphate synthase [geranylgeranyl-diphosphate specific]
MVTGISMTLNCDSTRESKMTDNATSEEMLMRQIGGGIIPTHIAIVMDGNRRYAKKKGLLPIEGHRCGAKVVENVLRWSCEIGIGVLTVFAFSKENTKRPSGEIDDLMALFIEEFEKSGTDEWIHANQIRINVLGNKKELPDEVQTAIQFAETKTLDNDGLLFNVAMNYSGREEIIRTVRHICQDVQRGRINIDDIDDVLITSHFAVNGVSEPDMIIRTSGEKRISNFLLWQVPGVLLHFTDVYWPNFDKVEFLKAIRYYQRREGEMKSWPNSC